MCHVCVLSLICLFIISGEFDALHQLPVKKMILWKYSIQSLKTADAVQSCEIMADATFFICLAPSWALFCSEINVEPYIPKGPANVKITTLYRLGPPHGHTDSCFLCYFYYVFFFFWFVWFVKFVHVHFICAPSRKNAFREWSTWCVSNQPGQPQKLARI